MRTVINALGQMPEYIYMKLPSGEADVFIYKSTEEENWYETNEFRTKKFTEEDIAKDPFFYLDYTEKEETLEEKVKRLEAKINELTFRVTQVSENVLEVVKKENSEMPDGDYLNPILYNTGDRVTQPNWYYTMEDGKNLPKEAIKTGYPTGWDDESFFA